MACAIGAVYIDFPDTATRAGPHNGDAGRVGDPPHGSGVEEDVSERTTRMHTLCRETMAQNTYRTTIFGDSFVDIYVKATRGRHGAERADPPTPGGSGVQGGRRRNRAERRSEAGEIRLLRIDRVRLRIIIGVCISGLPGASAGRAVLCLLLR